MASMKTPFVALLFASGMACAATPSDLQNVYAAQGASRPDATRGQRFFLDRHGGEWACATCHGDSPTASGRHAATGRAIEPLAPAFNPARFTDPAKVEKWFRRNCRDVAGRECSASEKADVIAWLSSLKP
jgi:hypothetical protein